MTSPPSLRSSLQSAQATVTAEVGPPRGADPEAVRRKVEPLRGWVDAVNITDGQGAHARLSNWAGSLLAIFYGFAIGAVIGLLIAAIWNVVHHVYLVAMVARRYFAGDL